MQTSTQAICRLIWTSDRTLLDEKADAFSAHVELKRRESCDFARLFGMLRKNAGGFQPRRKSEYDKARAMRVLLADDQEDIRLLTKQYLESAGHHLVAVSCGDEAVRAFRQQPFDVILLDEQMPGMTGTAALRAIREEEKSGRPAVIALTGYNTESDRRRLLHAGFDAVLGKPFRLELLDAILHAAAKGKASQATEPAPLCVSQDSPADPLARLGGDEQLLRTVARTFLRDLPTRLVEIQKSIHEKQGETLASLAHALKGSLGIFGVHKAVALCLNLQEFGQTGHFADATHAVAALKEAIAELEPNLRGYAGHKRTTAPGAPRSKTKPRLSDSKKKKP